MNNSNPNLAWLLRQVGQRFAKLRIYTQTSVEFLQSVKKVLGIAALAYAIVPRASAGIAYGLLTVAFLWYLVGAVIGAPTWLVELTPFAHVGLVPTQAFRVGAACIMVAIGAAAAAAALAVFSRRDLLGA